MNNCRTRIVIQPRVEFPTDEELPDLPGLFDGEWVWSQYCGEFGEQEIHPGRFLVHGVSHTRGRQAVVSYEVEWPDDAYLPNERFTFHLGKGGTLKISRFPDDEYLPGLGDACSPESAQRLVSKHVTALPPRRIRVEVIRYRPGSHAVLRHRMGRSRLYVRVVRPSAIPAILKSAELIGKSDFAVPRLAGQWQEGGVLWFSEMPGRNLRRLLRKGEPPPPGLILDGLESLWAVPQEGCDILPFNLVGAYRRAKSILQHSVLEGDDDWQLLDNGVQALDEFTENWQATATAHNDFYDDQMVMLPDGRIALVDVEGTGPGDPLLDVGNFLAHLKWSSQVSRRGLALEEYHDAFRREALNRFLWSGTDLDLREAVCLFRLCTNAVRHPRDDWRERLAQGLTLVNEFLP